MCFFIHYDWEQPRIAEHDIVCYKTTARWKYTDGENFRSSVFSFDYVVDKLYYQMLSFGWSNHRKTVEAGFHSHSECPTVWKDSAISVAKFIIPKGSEYFYNSIEEEYCSSHIIFKKILK